MYFIDLTSDSEILRLRKPFIFSIIYGKSDEWWNEWKNDEFFSPLGKLGLRKSNSN